MAVGDVLWLLNGRTASESVFLLEMQHDGSDYQLRVNTQLDDASWTATSWYSISDDWQAVEVSWEVSGLITPDGEVKLWVDGVLQETLGSLDNDSFTIEELRLGAMDVYTGTSGTIYIDDFRSNRYSEIGMLPSTGPILPEPTAQPSWLASAYNYENGKAHAVSSVVREQADSSSYTDSYTYDANGNMLTRVENGVTYTHTYNAENRLASITSGTESWEFTYDGDGVRVYEKYKISSALQNTRYFFGGGTYELSDDGSTQSAKKYYSLAGQMIAMDDGTNLVYFATDHLSSTSIIMNTSGTLLSEQRYLPFGELRTDVSGILQTDLAYTGQRDYSGDFGLMDYNARFYSPLLGRFTQPDSIIPDGNPQHLNRFSYTLNNPVKYTDPSGHRETGECGIEGMECWDEIEITDDFEEENDSPPEPEEIEEFETYNPIICYGETAGNQTVIADTGNTYADAFYWSNEEHEGNGIIYPIYFSADYRIRLSIREFSDKSFLIVEEFYNIRSHSAQFPVAAYSVVQFNTDLVIYPDEQLSGFKVPYTGLGRNRNEFEIHGNLTNVYVYFLLTTPEETAGPLRNPLSFYEFGSK